MPSIPESHRDLLTDEKRALAFVGTVMSDGSPQVTPVWFNTDGEYFCINTARGRVKDRNLRARPAVALTISDPGDPYRYIQIRGRVVEFTEEGAKEHMDELSYKYEDKPWSLPPGQVRVRFKIQPERITAHA
ncbi:MAG TPA: PPOX class F420-dependent oxidoreductase [Anaerolineales bacterium]|nr:PPOX class F420-dependent oxidoreductase [Anaerolineales bacterium]